MVGQYQRFREAYSKCSILKLETALAPKHFTYPLNYIILNSKLHFSNVIVSHVLKHVISNFLHVGLCPEIHDRHEFWVGKEGNLF